MPLRSKVADGVIHPSEMAFLQEIFDEVCRAKLIPPNSAAAENLAAELVDAFLAGVRDRDELQGIMISPPRSKAG